MVFWSKLTFENRNSTIEGLRVLIRQPMVIIRKTDSNKVVVFFSREDMESLVSADVFESESHMIQFLIENDPDTPVYLLSTVLCCEANIEIRHCSIEFTINENIDNMNIKKIICWYMDYVISSIQDENIGLISYSFGCEI